LVYFYPHIIFSLFARRLRVDTDIITFGNVWLYNATYYSFVLDHEATQNTWASFKSSCYSFFLTITSM